MSDNPIYIEKCCQHLFNAVAKAAVNVYYKANNIIIFLYIEYKLTHMHTHHQFTPWNAYISFTCSFNKTPVLAYFVLIITL